MSIIRKCDVCGTVDNRDAECVINPVGNVDLCIGWGYKPDRTDPLGQVKKLLYKSLDVCQSCSEMFDNMIEELSPIRQRQILIASIIDWED